MRQLLFGVPYPNLWDIRVQQIRGPQGLTYRIPLRLAEGLNLDTVTVPCTSYSVEYRTPIYGIRECNTFEALRTSPTVIHYEASR